MKQKKIESDQQFYENAWGQWDDMKSFGPSSRHVRRLTLKMIKGLRFDTYLDAGCGYTAFSLMSLIIDLVFWFLISYLVILLITKVKKTQ